MGESFVEIQLPGCFCYLEGCKHGFWAALLYTTSMASKKDKMPPSYNSTPPPLKGFSDVSSRNKSQIGFHQADLAPSTQCNVCFHSLFYMARTAYRVRII